MAAGSVARDIAGSHRAGLATAQTPDDIAAAWQEQRDFLSTPENAAQVLGSAGLSPELVQRYSSDSNSAEFAFLAQQLRDGGAAPKQLNSLFSDEQFQQAFGAQAAIGREIEATGYQLPDEAAPFEILHGTGDANAPFVDGEVLDQAFAAQPEALPVGMRLGTALNDINEYVNNPLNPNAQIAYGAARIALSANAGRAVLQAGMAIVGSAAAEQLLIRPAAAEVSMRSSGEDRAYYNREVAGERSGQLGELYIPVEDGYAFGFSLLFGTVMMGRRGRNSINVRFNQLTGVAKEAKWVKGRLGIEGPGFGSHYRKHGTEVGASTRRQYDLSARETIQSGQEFSYRDRTSNENRVGYFDKDTGLFTVTSQTRSKPAIITHYAITPEELRRLPGSTYR